MFLKTRGALCASLIALVAAWTAPAPVSAVEVELKAIAAWPKTLPTVSKSFLRFVKVANEAGKGEFRIRHIGGPEIAKATAQPEGFKLGLYDIMYTAVNYHRGIIPETDALQGTKVRPWVARLMGGLAALNEAFTKKINGRIISHTDSSVSFQLYLRDMPRRTADGGLDLSGLKIRSVPIYDGFLKGMGATTVTIHAPELYNALERGLVDGFAWPEMWTAAFGWAKFVKYRIYPTFYQLEPVIVLNNDSWRRLSKKGQDIIARIGAEHEMWSFSYWEKAIKKEREMLNSKYGQTEIHLPDKAARAFVDAANRTPRERLAKVGTPEAKALGRIYHGGR